MVFGFIDAYAYALMCAMIFIHKTFIIVPGKTKIVWHVSLTDWDQLGFIPNF